MKKEKLAKIRTAFGVTEYRLSNGLRLLYKSDREAPVVAGGVTYHVGSRNEAAGHTGSTHLLEHLLFKDTKNFNAAKGNAITNYLEWFGAYMNATTWLDRTNYFELLPRERLSEALAVEADRMRNSLFSETDLQSEMPVVRNEFERSRNNPFELLDEEVMSAAFAVHPYQIPTIGTKEDIERATAEKLHEFYNRFYWPNNATLSIFGDVPFAKVKQLVLKHFGKISTSPEPIPTMNTVEPPQEGPHRVTLTKSLGVAIVMLAYKIPEGINEEYPALLLLGAILGGGFASRLSRALVDRGLAADVNVSIPALHDPGVLTLTAHVAHGIKPKGVIAAMQREVATFTKKAPASDEMARARERLLSQFAAERDGVFSEIRMVSESIAAGDWQLGYTVEQAILKLKPADVFRVAKKYLRSLNETSGILEEKND